MKFTVQCANSLHSRVDVTQMETDVIEWLIIICNQQLRATNLEKSRRGTNTESIHIQIPWNCEFTSTTQSGNISYLIYLQSLV